MRSRRHFRAAALALASAALALPAGAHAASSCSLMQVIGTPGRDRYVAHDDLGASIDLDGDGDPDFVSTDVARVVMRGMAGDDVLSAGAGPGDRMSRRAELYGGAGNDVLRGGRSGEDRLVGGPGFDTVRAGDTVTGFERAKPGSRP